MPALPQFTNCGSLGTGVAAMAFPIGTLLANDVGHRSWEEVNIIDGLETGRRMDRSNRLPADLTSDEKGQFASTSRRTGRALREAPLAI